MAAPLVFEFSFALPQAERPQDDERPMRILLLGDFSGRASQRLETVADLATRRIHAIDIDNLDAVMARLPVGLDLHLNGPDGAPTHLRFTQLDDFHPDALYRTLDLFQALATARHDLHQPRPHQGGQGGQSPAGQPSAFEDLLGRPIRRVASAAAPAADGVDDLVNRIVGAIPSVQATPHAQIAALDELIGERMRALLHDPALRALEAAWRGVHLLITSLELDEKLQLHVLDVSQAELQADLEASGGKLDETALQRRLADSGPWSVLVANYRFGNSAEELRLLAALGAIGARNGAPLLAGADEHAIAQDPGTHWQDLRSSAHASWIALAAPRLLMRLPYGKLTDSTAAFAFEEIADTPQHADYVWGNSAFGCALLLGQSFSASGWSLQPGDHLDIADMPAHTYRIDGEAHLQACAERYLSDSEALAMLELGLIPVLSARNRNAVRMLRLQSIASPAQALAGGW